MSSASSAVTYISFYTNFKLGRVFWGADEELSDGAIMSSASSAVTYTSVYTDFEPGMVFCGADEELSDGGSPRVIMYGYDSPSPNYVPGPEEPHTPPTLQDEDEHEPMFIQPHDPDFRIQAAQDRQKSYADMKRKPMEFEVGDRVMLKVSPWKEVVRFGKRGKLNPRYVGPFKVLAKVQKVSYMLELPHELSSLCKNPFKIMEREIKRLKQSRIPQVKVCWNSMRGLEFTWEREDSFKQKYPQLFTNRASSSTTRS
nr:putative reverse transcriptase domain-containing protein [Tanacetum cinerariifolium]